MKNLWRSGIAFTAINILTLLIGFGFNIYVSHQLKGQTGEFGYFQAAITFVGFLGLPLGIATYAVTHYIARFHFSSDNDRLQGLLSGCRKFLLRITIVCSLAAVVLVKPLGDYFNIPRPSLTVVALVCVLAGFWSSFITAFCQGLGWFKRFALIALLAAVIRFTFGATAVHFSPLAEWAVFASTVMLLSNLVLLFWKHEFPRNTTGATVSPWTAEMVQFLVLSAAYNIGSSCLGQYDLLVAQRYFGPADMDSYSKASYLARQIPTLVGPLLTVLYTHRSSRHRHQQNELVDQMKLLGLYAAGLLVNATGLVLLKSIGLRLLNHDTPETVGMIAPLAITMVFVGLLQAIGTWALASRWIKISLLYGALGFAYWLSLRIFGQTPQALLRVMPIASSAALAVLFLIWFTSMRLNKIKVAEPDPA
jgi:hypothetical protein